MRESEEEEEEEEDGDSDGDRVGGTSVAGVAAAALLHGMGFLACEVRLALRAGCRRISA